MRTEIEILFVVVHPSKPTRIDSLGERGSDQRIVCSGGGCQSLLLDSSMGEFAA